MRINAISFVPFEGKIIDSHVHVGNWQGSVYKAEQLDRFIKEPLSNGDTIEKVIVSNLDCIDKNTFADELTGNIEMLKIAEKNPKIAPLAVCKPKTGSVKNIKKLFRKYSGSGAFVGLKFHPDGHEINANDERFIPYLKFAQKKKLPCLFHCGINWQNGELVNEALRYSSPEKIYEAAKKIPDTPVILAHLGAGGEKVHPFAIKTLIESVEKGDATLYTDISWVDIDKPDKPTIIDLIKKLKTTSKGDMTGRLLFGSDTPIGEFSTGKNGLNGAEFYDKTVVDLKSAIKNNFKDDADEIIDKIFHKNADELFFQKNWAKRAVNIEPDVGTKIADATKSIKKMPKIGLIAFGAVLAAGALVAAGGALTMIFKNKSSAKEQVKKEQMAKKQTVKAAAPNLLMSYLVQNQLNFKN